MPNDISGPALDAVRDELIEWYAATKEFLIQQLTEGGYPYGSVRLSEAQQLERWRGMTPQDHLNLQATLARMYQGDPNAVQKVQTATNAYMSQMSRLQAKYDQPSHLPITGSPL